MPKLEELPNDIYNLFNEDVDHVPSEDNLNALAENIKSLMRNRLAKRSEEARPLRFSALGKPDRQIWYDAHPDGTKEKLNGPTYVKFMYGDLIEQMLLFLAKEAGHEVTDEQAGVSVNGVTGSIDAIIDGTVVDVKSASPFGYKKFEQRSLTEDDPFGYVAQLAGYTNVLTPGEGAAWLANDKVSGEICISPLSATVIRHFPPEERIEELKEIVSKDSPPERCYEDVPDGKSGNRKLVTGCSYCAHKFRCWDGLRTFLYSTGPRYLTVVAKTPEVHEVSK